MNDNPKDTVEDVVSRATRVRNLATEIDADFWNVVRTTKEQGPELSVNLETLYGKFIRLYGMDHLAARYRFKFMINRSRFRLPNNQALISLFITLSLNVRDTMTQRLVTRAIVCRQDLKILSYLVSLRTKTAVDLSCTDSLQPVHVACLSEMIKHMGMHDIYSDFLNKKNLIHLANINDELASVLEEHMLVKARRYKNFYNLVQYLDAFPKADKKRFFVEIFKNKKHFSARIAIDRLKKHPELQKYYVML